jgi:porphobilinogen synthase
MPGVQRRSVDGLFAVAEECVRAGRAGDGLFPVIDAALKTPDGREATNPEGLVPSAVRELKKRFPELGLLTDVALDPFTSHGQDGLLDDTGYILNDDHRGRADRSRRWCRPRPAWTSSRPAT